MKRCHGFGFALFLLVTLLSACQGQQPEGRPDKEAAGTLQIQSDAFEAGGTIPQRFTCDGEDVSPPLSWSEPPEGTLSLVLVCDDPDAPLRTWDHWVLFNLPATTRALAEGVPADPAAAGIGLHGSNSWKRLGYGGPCPPPGQTHRYYFRLYALDDNLALDAGASREDVEGAMKGHVLAQGELMARYGR